MKIRAQITFLFTVVTALILLVFASVIYYTANESREREFYSLLKKEAVTKANLFFDANVNRKHLQEIYKNNRKILDEVEIAIYDTDFNLLYHDAEDIDYVKESREMIGEILRRGEISFNQGKWQVVGIRYEFNGESYIVTATAYDHYGFTKLNRLLKDCILVFIISILFIYLAGRFFSGKVLDPVIEMTERAKVISATSLDLRIKSNGSRDELSELANTFNEMLERLENSFESQKHFVSNISHEIRTPLAAIITELELSSDKERTREEYKAAIRDALLDARKLAHLSNSLLDLAKASYDPAEIAFKEVRVDEILLDARYQLQKANPSYRIDIHFENDFDSDNQISLNGNEYLLKVAFTNLFENGCKFSGNNQSLVTVAFRQEGITLKFSDEGIGIPEDDMENIFTPFYRGKNRNFAYGNGIGLSLTRKIIDLHKGSLSVESEERRGTTFTVVLNHL